MNKPVCLGLSILELSKILMYDFWYDYGKPKYGKEAKWWKISIVYWKTGDIYKDIAEDVETRLDTSNYELDRPLPNREKSNWINKRWIRSKNHDKIYWIRSKNL